MKHPVIGTQLKNPCKYSKLQNPLANGDKVKKLRKQHTESLKKHLGMYPLTNPLI